MTPTTNLNTQRRALLGRLMTESLNKRGPMTPVERRTVAALHAEILAIDDDEQREAEVEYGRVFRACLTRGKLGLNPADAQLFQDQQTRSGLLSTGGAFPGSTGGWFAPVQFVDEVFSMMKAYDRLFDPDVVQWIPTIRGGPAGIPGMLDTNSAATLVAQSAASNEVLPVLGQLSFETCPTWRSGMILMSRELNTDSGVSLDSLLASAFATRLARGIGAAIVQTMLSAATLGATAAGSGPNDGVGAAATSVGTPDLHALVTALDPAYAASAKCRWAMSLGTLQALYALLDKQGRPVLRETYNAAGEPMLLGRPVALCPSMPSIGASNTPIAIGDFSKLVVRTVIGGMMVRRYEERFAEFGQLAWEAFLRADSGVQIITSSPVAPSPIVYLQNAA